MRKRSDSNTRHLAVLHLSRVLHYLSATLPKVSHTNVMCSHRARSHPLLGCRSWLTVYSVVVRWAEVMLPTPFQVPAVFKTVPARLSGLPTNFCFCFHAVVEALCAILHSTHLQPNVYLLCVPCLATPFHSGISSLVLLL